MLSLAPSGYMCVCMSHSLMDMYCTIKGTVMNIIQIYGCIWLYITISVLCNATLFVWYTLPPCDLSSLCTMFRPKYYTLHVCVQQCAEVSTHTVLYTVAQNRDICFALLMLQLTHLR